ncbi:hypothetical protein RMN57_22890 [Kitasatospora sp. CM 4170]|uniref:Uncharacterized protein n=1 Tax=Kitasatospora aburaviensis TaxID=67265 RepID=A0ABW1F0Q1_9ACTN|nr:hypothetical protein [Kitasatospora sp. CM 4170]WNM47340.1 hypothetical protein RMN57_22890 [Kitasatospora sp. CM 4170]
MTQPSIRPNVIDLLCNADFSQYRSTNILLHQDGRPFTTEERALADSATHEELDACMTRHNREVVHARMTDDATQALIALLLRYFAKLPAGSVVGDAVDAMSGHDRAEFDRLYGIVGDSDWLFIPSKD